MNKVVRKRLLSISILLLITFNILAALNLNTIGVSAVEYPAVYIEPAITVDPTLTLGSQYTISIKTDYNGSDIQGYQFTLSYNPDVLYGVSVLNGDLIVGGTAQFIAGTFNHAAGELSLTGAFFTFFEEPAPVTSGPGTLATVTFVVKGLGTSNITLGTGALDPTRLMGYTDGINPDTNETEPGWGDEYNIVDGFMSPRHIGHGFFSNVPLPPAADADGPYSGYEGTPITFDATGSTDIDGTIDLYEWDWDNDGTYDESTTSPTIDHTWLDDHTGTVGLRVTDDDGQTDTATASVTVNNVAPTVNAGPDRTVYVNQTASFTGSFTDPGLLDDHTIFWDFGDGSNATDTLTPTHNYTDVGVYTVTLKVTDDDGGVGLNTLDMTVSTVPVHDVAILSVTPNATKVVQGSVVNIVVVAYNEGTETETFNVIAYANTIEIETQPATNLAAGTQTTLNFIWDTTGFSLGSYTIKAVASTVPNETDTADNTLQDGTVKVTKPPVADADGPYSDYEGSPITFDATASADEDGTIVLYEWDWDNDGSYDESTTSPTIDHTWGDDYAGAVGLRVTDDDGLNDTTTASLTVENVAPTVEAGLDQTVNEGDTVSFSGSFTDPGSDDNHTYLWDFGDGESADNTLTPTHVYTDVGVYPVTLTVTDDDGGVGTDTLSVTVLPAVFSVTVDELEFNVAVESNSTVSGFDFRKDQKEISFSVAGPDGTVGFCNVTIPMDLMKGEPSWTILVDGDVPTSVFQSNNGTHTFLYFTYTHTTHNIKIRGTWVVPEFPTILPLLLVLAILAVSTIILKRRTGNNRARIEEVEKE